MNLSLNWLKKYVHLPEHLSPEMIAEKLSTSGFEIEEFQYTGCNIQGMVIGHVNECIAHPNSDHLHICHVDIGESEPVQIVCGAPNVAKGQTVPVATVGTDFGNGFKIKKSKLRGEVSMGMICSERELGLSNSHDGIMVLETSLPLGTPIAEYFTDHDVIFDISITPNRADCFNHVSIARELAVMFDCEFKLPEIRVEETGEATEELIKINLEENSGCERFTARVVKGVRVAESPQWLQDALIKIGQRPINNLVDISNYVMFELGQPLHFYDYDKIKGHTLTVRSARHGEKVVTLDEKQRELSETVIVIEDAETFACLGGVMGGQTTEVSDDTVNVLIEAAIWTPSRIMKINRELGSSSEASYRFSKGVDFNGVMLAQVRAAQLIKEICGGDVSHGILDVATKSVEPWVVPFRYERCDKMLGYQVSRDKIDHIFTSLELTKLNERDWLIPTYRHDLTREIDLIEEVARIYGLENIPSKAVTEINYDVVVNEKDVFVDELKSTLVSMGIQEMITTSMVRKVDFDGLSKNAPVEIMNPLNDEADSLRTTIIPSILRAMDHNIKRQQPDLRVFEINNDYCVKKKNTVQTTKLVVGITGSAEDKHWDNSIRKVDFYDIKGITESLLQSLGITTIDFEIKETILLSGESMVVNANKTPIGFLGKIDASVKKKLKLSFDAYVLELNVDELLRLKKPLHLYSPISKFPIVERDIAMCVKTSVPAKEMLDAISEFCGELLKSVTIFDVYKDTSFAKDEHSIAFKLYFGADKTLTDDEINPLFRGSINCLSEKFGASLRDG